MSAVEPQTGGIMGFDRVGLLVPRCSGCCFTKNVSEYLERFARSSLKSEVCSLCSQFVFAVCVCSLCRRDRATIGVYSI